MKNRRFRGLRIILIFLAVAALMLTIQPAASIAKKDKGGDGDVSETPPEPPPADTPTTAEETCDCVNLDAINPLADPDGDGVNNRQECLGLDPNVEPGVVYLSLPGFCSSPQGTLNPVEQNIFVTLAKANEVDPSVPSNLTELPDEVALDCLSKPQADGGLGLRVTLVPYSEAVLLPERWVIENRVRLLWIEESLESVPYMGKCDNSWGTPQTIGKCWVFTKAIIRDVDSKTTNNVIDNLGGEGSLEVYQHHFMNTICHECAHGVKLRKLWIYETGGNHWAVEDMVYDSQFIDHDPRKQATTFYFGNQFFIPADLEDFIIWE